MTVSIETTRHIYQGNGVNRLWEFTFPIVDVNDVEVWVTEPDAVAAQVATGLYRVNESAMNVEYPLGDEEPLPSGYTIVIRRYMDILQETEFVNQGKIQAESIEDSLDRLTMICQQLNDTLGRAIKVGVDEESVTDVDELLTQIEAYVSQMQAFVNQVTALLAEAEGIAEAINQAMPSGFNRFRVNPSTMELEMAYLGESTNDQVSIVDGDLVLTLYDVDEVIGRVAMVYAGTWNSLTFFPYLSLVTHEGSTYLCAAADGNTGTVPPSTDIWEVIGQGGSAATIDIGAVTALPAGSVPTVTNTGTANAAVFNFGIPRGAAGAAGAQGPSGLDGVSATIEVESVTTLAAGEDAYVNNLGGTSAAMLAFGIPRGADGATGPAGAGIELGRSFETLAELQAAYPTGSGKAHVVNGGGELFIYDDSLGWVSAGQLQGAQGDAGADGAAATIAVGETTTGAAGSSASVTNTGTTHAAVFNFTIPRGQTGATGATGSTGATPTVAVGSVTLTSPGSPPTITNTGTSTEAVFSFSLPENSWAPYEGIQNLGTVNGAVTVNGSAGNIVAFTVGAALTLTFNPDAENGFARVFTLMITNGGSYTVTWPTSVRWSEGSAPSLSAGGTDVISLLTIDGGTIWYGMTSGLTFA